MRVDAPGVTGLVAPAAGAVGAVGVDVTGATGAGAVGCAGAVVTVGPAITGVTLMPTTLPVTPFFCTEPMVWRAARVAVRLAAAVALASTVLGPVVLGAVIPKSFRTALAFLPYCAMRADRSSW